MHNFDEIIYYCVSSTLNNLEETNGILLKELETSGATSLVKGLQMVRLQKAILATGIFSLFEAELQNLLSCNNGFKTMLKILEREGEVEPKKRFNHFYLAINVLKHGRGTSYDSLISELGILPFEIKSPIKDENEDENSDESDISAISTLIEVDDDFVLNCAKLIEDISLIVRNTQN